METLADFLALRDEPRQAERETSLADLTGSQFCQAVIGSREYRQSILDRVALGSLAPAVECRLLDMAWGKAPQRVEHTGKDGQPIESVTEVRRVIIRVGAQTDDGEPVYVTH